MYMSIRLYVTGLGRDVPSLTFFFFNTILNYLIEKKEKESDNKDYTMSYICFSHTHQILLRPLSIQLVVTCMV